MFPWRVYIRFESPGALLKGGSILHVMPDDRANKPACVCVRHPSEQASDHLWHLALPEAHAEGV